MGFNEFKAYLEKERLSRADIFLEVTKRIRVCAKISFTVNKTNEAKLSRFFDKVNNKIKLEGLTIESNSDKNLPYCEKLKSWRRKNTNAALEPALLVYYWFHAHCEIKDYAEYIDRELFSGCLFKDKFPDTVLTPPETTIYPSEDKPPATINEPPSLSTQQWLDPNNHQSLPFVGRVQEIEQLNAFANDGAPFRIWAIIGPSGAGKTRLCHAWRYGAYQDTQEPSAVRDWHQEILHVQNQRDWTGWEPDRSTLLIIDSVSGFSDTFKSIIRRCRQPLPDKIKVRLLIVDHVFPERLEALMTDSRWGLRDMDGSDFHEHIGSFFFQERPILLNGDENEDQNRLIEAIIRNRAGSDTDEPMIQKAIEHLKAQKNAWHPLFAALAGNALREKKHYRTFNRRQLVLYYLAGSNRLPWQQKQTDGKIASAFVAASTARKGVEFELLKSCVHEKEDSQLENEGKDYQEVADICRRIVSKNEVKPLLPPFEPDILGESFFLLFLEDMEKFTGQTFKPSFLRMLSEGSETGRIEAAQEFIRFITGLVQNLCGDHQEGKEIEGFWQVFFYFMQPARFPAGSRMRWAISAALMEVFDLLAKHRPENVEAVLAHVDIDALQDNQEPELLDSSLASAMKHFECSPVQDAGRVQRLQTFANIYDEKKRDIDGTTALMVAAAVGCISVLRMLVEDHKVEVDQVDKDDYTALRWATIHGQAASVQILIENGADLERVDYKERTTLMLVARQARDVVAQILIDNGADFEKRDYEGRTALIFAAIRGCDAIVQALIDKGADFDKVDDQGRSALFYAALYEHDAVARVLLENKAKLETADNDGYTALGCAAYNKHEAIVKMLVEAGAKN